MEYNRIYNESCLTTMQRLEDNSIHLVITSPPYDNLRTYGNVSSWSFDTFKPIAEELTRTLKEGGVIMWNVQDATINGSRTGTSFKQALYFMELGLNLYDHLIWQKTGTPFPSTIRYRNVWENMFVFSKGKPNHFNPILKRNVMGGDSRNRRRERNKDGELVMQERRVEVKEWGIENNVWSVSNHFTKTNIHQIKNHPAIMPEELVRRHIQTWSIEGEIVYDPFSGSGTTSKVAAEMGRTYLGSEINPEYYEASIGILNETLKYKQFFE